jgi:hypothetical protein
MGEITGRGHNRVRDHGNDVNLFSFRHKQGRRQMPDRPVLTTSPPDDDAFRDQAERLLANGAATASALERGLRLRYPKAVVRARDLAGERAVVWYVYRDGRWTRSAEATSGRGSGGEDGSG